MNVPSLLVVTFFSAAFLSPGAHAQQPGSGTAQTAPVAKTTKAAEAKKSPLTRVLQAMQYAEIGARQANVPGSSGNGFTLVAESSIAQTPVSYPGGDALTTANIEEKLDALIKELPKGTRWVKLMLPPPPTGKTLKGDDLADFALAQARLYGSVGETVLPPGSVEVLSQAVASDKAATVVPALNLRPVYLVVNPAAHNAMMRGLRDFGDLTPDQQKQWARNAAPMFQSMTPKERMAAFQNMTAQMSAIIEAVTENMSGEQIKQFFEEMGGKTTDHSAELKLGTVGGGGGTGK